MRVKIMGGPLAVPRKRHKHPIIKQTSKLFSDAMHNKDFKQAADIALYAVFKIHGINIILSAIDDAHSFLERDNKREKL